MIRHTLLGLDEALDVPIGARREKFTQPKPVDCGRKLGLEARRVSDALVHFHPRGRVVAAMEQATMHAGIARERCLHRSDSRADARSSIAGAVIDVVALAHGTR